MLDTPWLSRSLLFHIPWGQLVFEWNGRFECNVTFLFLLVVSKCWTRPVTYGGQNLVCIYIKAMSLFRFIPLKDPGELRIVSCQDSQVCNFKQDGAFRTNSLAILLKEEISNHHRWKPVMKLAIDEARPTFLKIDSALVRLRLPAVAFNSPTAYFGKQCLLYAANSYRARWVYDHL